MSRVTHVWMRHDHVWHTSCTHQGTHIWTSYVIHDTRMNESCHTLHAYEWVMSMYDTHHAHSAQWVISYMETEKHTTSHVIYGKSCSCVTHTHTSCTQRTVSAAETFASPKIEARRAGGGEAGGGVEEGGSLIPEKIAQNSQDLDIDSVSPGATAVLAPTAAPPSQSSPPQYATYMNESRHVHKRVMSRTWMSHVTHMIESCHAYKWVTSHIWMSHVTLVNESCHTHERDMSHVWMSHVAHESCLTWILDSWVHGGGSWIDDIASRYLS